MKIEDLDKDLLGPKIPGRRKTKRTYKNVPKEDYDYTPSGHVLDGSEAFKAIHGITALIGLMLTLLFWIVFPASILLAVLTGIVWTVSGIARIATGEHLWVSAFSFVNALFPIISVLM
jgi:hypothetical protein